MPGSTAPPSLGEPPPVLPGDTPVPGSTGCGGTTVLIAIDGALKVMSSSFMAITVPTSPSLLKYVYAGTRIEASFVSAACMSTYLTPVIGITVVGNIPESVVSEPSTTGAPLEETATSTALRVAAPHAV